jgi:hypothetical protein
MWDVTQDVFCGNTSSAREAPEASGTCVWEFDGTQWKVKLLRATGHGVAGSPPGVPGRFRGQLRAMPCVASDSI